MFIRFTLGTVTKLIGSMKYSNNKFTRAVASNIWKSTSDAVGFGGIYVYVQEETQLALSTAKETFKSTIESSIKSGFNKALAVPASALSSMATIASSKLETVGTGIMGAMPAMPDNIMGKATTLTGTAKKYLGLGGSRKSFKPLTTKLKILKTKIDKSNVKPPLNTLPVILNMLNIFVPYIVSDIKESSVYTKHNLNCSKFNFGLVETTIKHLI